MKRFILITIAICSTVISMAQTDNIIRKKSTNVVSTVISNSTQKKNGSYTAPRKKTSTTSRKRAAKNGYGKEQYDGGSWYEGNFVNGTPSGQGTYHLADGMRIEGPFVDGVPHGESTIYFSDGTIFYKGNMSNGEICGEGIMVRGDSIVAQGVWSDNGQTGENINVTTFDGEPLFYGNIANGNYTNGLLYDGYDISAGHFDSNGEWQIEGYARRAQVFDDRIIFTLYGVDFTMIKVNGGTFNMGGSGLDSKPVHKVTLTKDYYIGQTEVTQQLWNVVMDEYKYEPKGDNIPVCVSLEDCNSFFLKLSELMELTFTPPTEAQWEFAARGGNKSKNYKFSGSNNFNEVGWCLDAINTTAKPVAQKNANELGIYDMSGNVTELCRDYWSKYTKESQVDPEGPASPELVVTNHLTYNGSFVIRGGGVGRAEKWCTVSSRESLYPGWHVGIRLCIIFGE